MLARGVYLPPSAYEVCFLSAAFGEKDLQYFAEALKESLGVASKAA
jgi:glutamate-1-semialdehyde aminotransferase